MENPVKPSLWQRVAPVLRIAGAVLVGAGTLHLYADRVVFDEDAFSERLAASLQDPRVAGFVAGQVADQVVAYKRDLMAYRPLIVGAARTMVSSDAFRAGFRRAARAGHAALLSQGVERFALAVPDLGVLVKSALAHDPSLAARVPPALRSTIEVGPSGKLARILTTVIQLGHRVRRNAYLAVVLGTLCLLGGILLPRDRRRALFAGGLTIAILGVVLLFLPAVARTVTVAFVPSEPMRPLVAGLWDGFFAGLRLWALVIGGVGLVLASAASSFASQVEIENVSRRFWNRLRQPARSMAGELLRVGLLVTLGLLAVLRPQQMLRNLMVLAGALIAFQGLRELFLLIAPRAAEDPGGPAALAGSRRRLAWRPALVGVMAVSIVATAGFYLRSRAATQVVPAITSACNGDVSLCDRRVEEVVFPAAHNAMSAAEFPGWMFPNQEVGPVSLLEHGIRALLFDVHYGTPIGGAVKTELLDEKVSREKFGKAVGDEAVTAAMRVRDRLTGEPTGPRAPYLCHGFCELGAVPLVGVLEGVRDFLVRNPGEVVLFVIEDYVSPQDVAAAFRQSGLERFVYRGAMKAPFPTLRQLIDADQRLLVFGENNATDVPWYHAAFDTLQETPYTFHTPQEFSCRPNRGGTAGPLLQVNHWIETTPTPKPSNAAIVNARDFLLARAKQCQRERQRLPNILAVDFALTGDVVEVAAELNGLAPSIAATGATTVASSAAR